MMRAATQRLWDTFQKRSFACPCCNRTVHGLFGFGYDAPTIWPHGPIPIGQDFLDCGEDILSSDQCEIGGHYFVKSILSFPILYTKETFGIDLWCSLSERNYHQYLENWENPARTELGPYGSWLGNLLPFGDDGGPHSLTLQIESIGSRPSVFVQNPDTPQFRWQNDGMPFDTLLDFYQAAGHPIRQQLLQMQ